MTATFMRLPDFDHPPVVEVVLGVAFEPSFELSNVALVELWRDLFKTSFPHSTERPPYDPPKEQFGVQIPRTELVGPIGPPPLRFWFASEDEQELIQIQHDWFARNWQKTERKGTYPRYDAYIRPAFVRDFSAFADHVRGLDLDLRFTQCEVTYINHISTNDIWQAHKELSAVFRTFADTPCRSQSIESMAFRSSSLISLPSSETIGRLHTQIDSVFDSNGRPIFVLTLTARGAPLDGHNVDAVMRFLDRGRDNIVRTFVEITTEEIQREWGRTQ